MRLLSWIALLPLLALLPGPACAGDPPPAEAAALPPPVEAPRDVPYPDTIELRVSPDLDHRVFNVAETIPLSGGAKLTLLYPKWIPGTHSPEGSIAALAGLTITAGGAAVPWVRDTVNVFAFHVEVPKGAAALELRFQYLSPVTNAQGPVVMTDRIALLQWWHDVIYPAGYYARGITVRPAFDLPAGWQYGSALEEAKRDGGTVIFRPVALDVLVDSPLYAGAYFARWDLAPGAKVPVHMDVVADTPEALAIKPEDLQAHRALVTQSALNYASQHYDHFDFLVAASDETSSGLEHHRSSENGVSTTYFTEPKKDITARTYLMPHEYSHSWDGKFRRPADLWSPDFNIVPERGSLLWVYEGQTQYWGEVIAARAGLQTAQQFRDYLALTGAELQAQAGRSWRDLQDTTNDPVINQRRPLAWRDWSRAEDYYMEGALMWLDADTLIREKTNNAASLTTFAQNFFGIDDGSYAEATYSFDDVVAALNGVYAYDWAGFLRARLDSHPNTALLDGIERAGWRLVFNDTESDLAKAGSALRKVSSFRFSLGLITGANGDVKAVSWGGPAYKAGLEAGVSIVAVNGADFDAKGLADAIKKAQATRAPIELLIHSGKRYRTVAVPYYDGLRYPHLERVADRPDLLADILAPLK